MVNTWGGDSQGSTETMLPYMEIDSPIYPRVYDCCGHSAPGCTFPCQCTNPPYNNGNCTWWVDYKYGSVPFTGNAYTWWARFLIIRIGTGRQVPRLPLPVQLLVGWIEKSGSPAYFVLLARNMRESHFLQPHQGSSSCLDILQKKIIQKHTKRTERRYGQ